MSHGLRSRHLRSSSLGAALRCPGCSRGALLPGSLSAARAPGTFHRGQSLHSSCQDTCWEPGSCFHPETAGFCSPCESSYTGPSGSAGSVVPAPGWGPSCFRPTCFSARSYQAPGGRPAFGSRCFGPTTY